MEGVECQNGESNDLHCFVSDSVCFGWELAGDSEGRVEGLQKLRMVEVCIGSSKTEGFTLAVGVFV